VFYFFEDNHQVDEFSSFGRRKKSNFAIVDISFFGTIPLELRRL
jgi:hypothetical protein